MKYSYCCLPSEIDPQDSEDTPVPAPVLHNSKAVYSAVCSTEAPEVASVSLEAQSEARHWVNSAEGV